MNRTWLHIALNFIAFALLQALVMNNIHLFDIVTPFVYLYVILKLPVSLSRSAVITISFLLGLVVDCFSNTFGMHAAACSLMGFVRAPLLYSLVDMNEVSDYSVPSYDLFGAAKFIRYALIMVVIHHFALFAIESFSFFNLPYMLARMSSSIALTLLLVLIIEAFNVGINKKSGK